MFLSRRASRPAQILLPISRARFAAAGIATTTTIKRTVASLSQTGSSRNRSTSPAVLTSTPFNFPPCRFLSSLSRISRLPLLPLLPHIPRISRLPHLRNTAVRLCSYRHRSMCKSLDTGAEGGATTVPARELLPNNVVPRHYHLTLEPDFEKFTFEGTVVIDLDVAEESNSISLHTLELKIHHAAIRSGGETVASAPTLAVHEPSQVTKIGFTNTLAKGSKAQLELRFTGELNDKMAGFYRSTWKKADGSMGIMGSTQMEATDARRAFPCFDEPALKAEFTVTLIADKKLTCLSNMDVASESDVKSAVTGKAKKSVTFTKSPVMSTYLVAWVIGELDCIETNDFRIPIRVFCPAGQDIEHGRFALNLTAKTLVLYEKLFGIDFPLPKMDQVAIPDFAQGAMENWGLVTYRTVDLMLDEKASGAATKSRVATVVVHELAHQWFGNLVTMEWWEGLWLNEGFAEWVSTYAINEFFPEWKVWEMYVTEDLQNALSLDSLRSSHPIEVPVKRADEINQIFDSISYSKGSCVLRMIANWLGEDVFLEGVRKYLKKHAWGNTTTGDLWASLSEVSGKNVDEIMTIWTKRVGYPVVTVTENDKGTIHLKQNRFLRAGDAKPEEDEVLYPIMLGIRTKDGVNKDAMLLGRETDIKVDGFYKINADHTGLFRTAYPPDRLEKLGEAAKEGLLTIMDKTGMIADTGALATSGYQKTSGALSLLKGFKEEKEFVVWSEIMSRIAVVESAWIFGDEAIRNGLEAFHRDLVSDKAHALGWDFSDKDDHVLQQFKAMMFGSAGIAGDKTIVKAAKDMFAKYMAGDKTAIHPNIRGSVFGMALKFGGKDEYEAILKFYHASTNSDERNTALRSLGRAKEPELIQQTLSLLTDPSVKDQDIYMPASSLRSHAEGIEALFGWMTQHWDGLVKRLPPTLPMLSSMVSILTSSLTTADQLAAVQDFFKSRNTDGFDQSLAQSLDSIRAKVAWVGRDDADVRDWLKSNGYMGST